jgi:hypothetical protein
MCRSQWPRALRHRSAAARLLRLWFRIPPGAWKFVCCACCVLSGRDLCDELIIRPEESYHLWCDVVCDLETSWMRRPWSTGGCYIKRKKKVKCYYLHLKAPVLWVVGYTAVYRPCRGCIFSAVSLRSDVTVIWFPGFLVCCADMTFVSLITVYLTTQCLKPIFKKWVGVALAWNRDESQGLVNAGMNLQVP